MIYPNPYMTGRSNYKNIEGKKAKAHQTKQIGIKKVQYAEKRLKATLKNYLNRQELATSKKLDFAAENLNEQIRNIRKQFRTQNLIIKKAFGGVRRKRRHATYYIKIHNKEFHLSINEFGNYTLLKFLGGEIYAKGLDSVNAMREELTSYLENLIKS